MNRKNYDLIFNIRKMNKLIADGNAATKAAEAERAAINADKDHSDTWKRSKIEAINSREQAAIRANGAKINELSDFFKGYCEAAENQFDYTDPALQQGLQMVQNMGMQLPVTVRNNIAEHFRGNPTALELLKIAFEKQQMNADYIEESRKLFLSGQRISDVLDEITGRATCPAELANAQWQPQRVQSLMRDFEKTFGVDANVNPYLAEIHSKQNDPLLSTTQRTRIKNFLDIYGEDLANDDEHATAKAIYHLEADFQKPLA